MIPELFMLAANGPENVWDITFGPYTDLLGAFFWAVPLFLMVILVWIKTQSFGPTFMVLIIGSLALMTFIPGEVQLLFIFAIAIGITYALYQLFFRRRPY